MNDGQDNWYYPKQEFDTDETMYYDLPDLRLVAAIADSGSLTRAAAQVHLAPSSASHCGGTCPWGEMMGRSRTDW